MKRAKHLYCRMTEPENLRAAFYKAAKGRRADPEVMAFRQDLPANLERLRSQFLRRKYELGDYHFFVIRDPKVRTICAASFPERVFHHAVMNVCEEVFEKYHIFDSYACRKGKGNVRAVARARQFAGRNAWFLKLDIAKFFDNIDHQVALHLLGRLFGDPDLLINRTATGIPFLGYRVFPGSIRLTAGSKKRFSRKYRAYEQYYCQGLWSAQELADHLGALCSFTQNCHAAGFRRYVIERFGVLS